jgi:hypothetical protein
MGDGGDGEFDSKSGEVGSWDGGAGERRTMKPGV